MGENVTITVEIPDGYEATGEYRPPEKGEWYLWHHRYAACRVSEYVPSCHVILRKKTLYYEDFQMRGGIGVDATGAIVDTGLISMTTAGARAKAVYLREAADHVDRVNAQKTGA